MEHVNYIENKIEYNYYRINFEELTKRVTIDNKSFVPFSFRNFEKRELKVFKNKRMGRQKYVMLHCAFDIETTTVYSHYDELKQREQYHSFMYIWQFSFISHDIEFVLKGRTWKEFENLMMLLSSKLSKNQKVMCWVHNLPYEFSFMKLRYHKYISNMFCKEHDKPIKFDFMEKIEFRDSLQLHNKGLKGLAEDFCRYRKLVGDLDYTIKRSSKDSLSERELRYCDNDVLILSQFAIYVWDNLIIDESIPLTQTGILRGTIKEYLKENNIYKRIINQVHDNFPSQELYNLVMNYLFKGGFCGSNFTIVGEFLFNLDSYDYESSYPAIMLQPRYRFPNGKFEMNNITTFEEFEERKKDKCLFALFRFYNLRPKTNHNFISKHKIYRKNCENVISLNGKVRRVINGYIEVFETDIDLENYKKFYEWDEESCIVACWECDYMYGLPYYITVPLINALVLKQTRKHSGMSYATEKAKLNSGYGMLTQKLIVKEILWNSENGEFEEEQIDDYNKMIRNRMFSPFLGIWVTAYARHNLLDGIYNYKDTCYGYDTDSMKGHFDDLTYIECYNEQCRRQNRLIADKYNIDFSIVENLGCWECETPTDNVKYKIYKTLGSKRYIYTNDNTSIHQTICGLGNNALFDHVKTKYKKEELTESEIVMKCFEEFKDGMNIKDAKKLYHELQEEVTATINGVEMHEYSGTVLTPNKFTMKIESFYANYIKSYYDDNNKFERRIL